MHALTDPSKSRSQWPILRAMLFRARLAMSSGVSREGAYKQVLEGDLLPEAKIMLSVFLVLCLSTVWCERGFSCMAMIKTKLHNCMNMDTLDALMMIAMNGPDFDDPAAVDALLDDALEHWKKKAKRNIKKSHPGVAGRKKKNARTVELSDLLQAAARAETSTVPD